MSIFIILLFIIAILIIVCKNSCSQNTYTTINNSDLSDNKPAKVMTYSYICERCGYIEVFEPNMDVECRFCGYEHMLQTCSSSKDFMDGYTKEYPGTYERYIENYNSKLRNQYVRIPTNRVYDEHFYNDLYHLEMWGFNPDQHLLPVIRCNHCGKKIVYKKYPNPELPEPICKYCGKTPTITKPDFDYTLRCADCMRADTWEYDVTHGTIKCSRCGYVAAKSKDILDE